MESIPNLILLANGTEFTNKSVEMECLYSLYNGGPRVFPIPVTVGGLEEGDSVEWVINDGNGSGYGTNLTEPNTYRVTVTVQRQGYDDTTLVGTLIITPIAIRVNGTYVTKDVDNIGNDRTVLAIDENTKLVMGDADFTDVHDEVTVTLESYEKNDDNQIVGHYKVFDVLAEEISYYYYVPDFVQTRVDWQGIRVTGIR